MEAFIIAVLIVACIVLCMCLFVVSPMVIEMIQICIEDFKNDRMVEEDRKMRKLNETIITETIGEFGIKNHYCDSDSYWFMFDDKEIRIPIDIPLTKEDVLKIIEREVK